MTVLVLAFGDTCSHSVGCDDATRQKWVRRADAGVDDAHNWRAWNGRENRCKPIWVCSPQFGHRQGRDGQNVDSCDDVDVGYLEHRASGNVDPGKQ